MAAFDETTLVGKAKNILVERKLHDFIGKRQIMFLADMLRMSEEREHFAEIVVRLAETVEKMPKTYETDEQGSDAIVYLHYFMGGIDAWITEKDRGDGSGINNRQLQAFGKITLTGNKEDAEYGYICIQELIDNNVELDFYWTPKKLKEL